MLCQQSVELFQPFGHQILEHITNPGMYLSAFLDQDALISGFLSQGVLEDVFQLGEALHLLDKLGALQPLQLLVKITIILKDGVQNPVEESTADDGGSTNDALEVLIQPVDPGDQQSQDGVRNRDLLDALGGLPAPG
jgi:hypothetical protein